MPCCSSSQPVCDSPFEPTPTGCCQDGRRCDEVCIAIVAAEECKQAGHTDEASSGCQDGCCQEIGVGISSRPEQPHSVEKLPSELQDSCCKDDANSCTSKAVPQCCRENCEQDKVGSNTASSKEGCCKSDNGTADGTDPCCGSQSSECCTQGTAASSGRVSKELGRANSCCDAETTTCVSPAVPSADTSIVTEFREACSAHLAEAMKKYQEYLKAGICICRNALGRVDSCCNKNSRAAIMRKRKISSIAPQSCCTSRSSSVKRCKLENEGIAENKDCCGGNKPITDAAKGRHLRQESCCPVRKHSCSSIKSVDATCEPVLNESVINRESLNKSKVVENIQDLEDGAAREHLTFNITGMTCTGCVKKIMGVLGNVDGVSSPRVNFVAAIGDVDVDPAKIAATNVLQRLEKETGFKCSRIISDYQTLDLKMTSIAAQALEANLPKGVQSIEKVRKDIYRISYDPLLIGARAILARSDGQMAPPSNDGAVSEGKRRFTLMFYSFVGAAIFTIPVCVLAFTSLSLPFLTKSVVELVLATFVQLVAVSEFYIPALKALIFSKTIEMDMLVVISITAAYGYSVVAFGLEVSGIDLEQGPIFETSTLLITLVLLGRLVASYAKVRAVQAVSLKSLQAETALLEDAEGKVTEVDARLLEFNDVVRIPPHSKIVSDGRVISGDSAVDESMLTGESLPVPKAIDDTVTAGTLNGQGALRIQLTRLPGKNSITDIAELVQGALNSKPRVQDLADVVAGYFVPVVVFIAVVVFAIWVGVALRIRNQNAGGAIGTAFTYSIAVLAISCPCALGLAVPLVLVISGGVAARSGVIIKQADATERGFKVTDIVFDKTGTLTTGQLEVVQQTTHESSLSINQVLELAHGLVKDDTHPVAQAVTAKLGLQDIPQEAVEAVNSVPGCGVEASWKGRQVRAGNPYWLAVDNFPSIATLQAEGYTLLCVTIDKQPVVSFGLKATIRPEAQPVISNLQRRGLTCHIVSGDQPTTVSNVATSLGVHLDHVVSRQSPANKQAYIQNLRSAGKATLFVGDGTNDAVAIAAADVGVQIGAASDVTRATANVVLLGGLEGIIMLLEVSKQSYYRIIFNFIWSGVYNLFAILLASGAFVKVRIAPNYAGLGEIVSVLPVVFAALTMLKVKGGMH